MEKIRRGDIIVRNNSAQEDQTQLYVVINVVDNDRSVLVVGLYNEEKKRCLYFQRKYYQYWVNYRAVSKFPTKDIQKTGKYLSYADIKRIYDKRDKIKMERVIFSNRGRDRKRVIEVDNKQYIHFVPGGAFNPR